MTGDNEADALMRVAHALMDTELGLRSIGVAEDGFSIVVTEEQTGLVIVFVHPNPVKVIDRFVEFCNTVKVVTA